MRFIKPVSDHLISPLVHIINNLIDKKVFPNSWKIARVCPIPRVDQPTLVKDFRPISVLPILSKVYERVILKQLCNFIEKESLYTTTQSDFRKGHSTTTILLKIRDDIKRAMNKSEVTLAILIDYSKAFDTIDQNILLEKLLKFNLSPQAIEIIFSYISHRKQYVQVDDTSSEISNMYFGIPQGSILGPVLFNFYVANLSETLCSTSAQYTDDTTIYDSCKNSEIKSCAQNLEKDLNNLSQWSTNENLFNEDKTKSILFSTSQLAQKHQLSDSNTYQIKCNEKAVKRVQCANLLGTHFDENFSWKDHVNNVVKSCSGTLRILRQFKRFTPLNVRKTLAETLV